MPIDWEKLEELNAKAHRISILAYQGPDGFPVLDPMLTVSSRRAGRFAMFTMKDSPKVGVLRKDPRATLTLGNVPSGVYALCKAQVRLVSYQEDAELFQEVYDVAKAKSVKSPDDPALLIMLYDIDEVVWCDLSGKTVARK